MTINGSVWSPIVALAAQKLYHREGKIFVAGGVESISVRSKSKKYHMLEEN